MIKEITRAIVTFDEEHHFDMIMIGPPTPLKDIKIEVSFFNALPEDIDLICSFEFLNKFPSIMPIKINKGFKNGHIIQKSKDDSSCIGIRLEANVTQKIQFTCIISEDVN